MRLTLLQWSDFLLYVYSLSNNRGDISAPDAVLAMDGFTKWLFFGYDASGTKCGPHLT